MTRRRYYLLAFWLLVTSLANFLLCLKPGTQWLNALSGGSCLFVGISMIIQGREAGRS